MSNLREPHKQEDIRKSNEYYMQMNEQKADFEPIPKGNSPFGILAILFLIISIPLTIFITPIAGLGLNIVAIIFSIIHRTMKKYGVGCLIISILITIITAFVTIIGVIQPNLIPIPSLAVDVKETKQTNTTTETEKVKKENSLINTGWKIKEDDSCFYFLEDETYYWCKKENDFDDNYYYGSYEILTSDKALNKLKEFEIELDTNSKENISNIYYINMKNEICYKDGEDISEEYNLEKPNRNYFVIFTKNNDNPIGIDVESYKELGFVNLTKISDKNIEKVLTDLKSIQKESSSKNNTDENLDNTDETTISTDESSNENDKNKETNGESQTNTTDEDLSFLDQYTTKSNNETKE